MEKACANCNRIYGSNSNHADRQYSAVDSITASSTPCSRSQVDNRRRSLGMVGNRRRQFLLSCGTWLPPGVEAAERARKRLHTVTCYHPSARMGGATQIGSKRTFPTKLINGLTSSRVQTIFAVHAIDRTRRLDLIFMSIGGPQAHLKLLTQRSVPTAIFFRWFATKKFDFSGGVVRHDASAKSCAELKLLQCLLCTLRTTRPTTATILANTSIKVRLST